jgi:methylated-DNA-protein-cysteine methyltransferase-like protein
MHIPPGFRIVAETSAFERSVADMVRRVPAGTVASYGRIAAWLGRPEAARAVGGAMARSPDGVPAHRVVTAGGRLAPGWEREQAELLRAEGVRVWRGHVREPIPWWQGPQRGASSTRPGRSSG